MAAVTFNTCAVHVLLTPSMNFEAVLPSQNQLRLKKCDITFCSYTILDVNNVFFKPC